MMDVQTVCFLPLPSLKPQKRMMLQDRHDGWQIILIKSWPRVDVSLPGMPSSRWNGRDHPIPSHPILNDRQNWQWSLILGFVPSQILFSTKLNTGCGERRELRTGGEGRMGWEWGEEETNEPGTACKSRAREAWVGEAKLRNRSANSLRLCYSARNIYSRQWEGPLAALAWCDMRSRDAPFSRLPRKMARNPTPLFWVVCLPQTPASLGGMPRCDLRKKKCG